MDRKNVAFLVAEATAEVEAGTEGTGRSMQKVTCPSEIVLDFVPLHDADLQHG